MEANASDEGSVAGLCRRAGISRQGVYKAKKVRTKKAAAEETTLRRVQEVRALHPKMGARKLLHVIAPGLLEEGLERPGRDALFALLRSRGLLLEKRRAFVPRTTESRHRFPKHENLLRKEDYEEPKGPGELLLSDITYLRTEEGFLYLALVMDGFSRKIVGYNAGESLEMEGAKQALTMALRSLAKGQKPIHHSDRGCQYACHGYTGVLEKRGCRISMTEENHCYENAKAERLNGILKTEYGLSQTFRTKAEAKAAAREATGLYNTGRPHLSLGMRTPEEAHGKAA